ncbi:MAG: radical SAM protein [Candidatus Omnitrophica bacterium]|nr:radical SAM protein [Candidatus Omnitrophota bacterium]
MLRKIMEGCVRLRKDGNTITLLNRKRSLPELFISYLKNNGLPYAMEKTFKYLNPRNIRQEYLEIMGILDGKHAYTGPSFIQIDITNDCNNDCIGCWCNSPLLGDRRLPPKIKSQSLPISLIKSFLDEAAGMGAKEIYYAGGGEPFMHPHIMEVLEYTKKKGLICYVNTNFTLIDREKVKRLVDLGLDHMTVSVWAGTAQTYRETHPNKSEETFLRIKDTLRYLNSLKTSIRKPYIKVYHVISSINYKEILEMVDFALDTDSESLEFTVIDTIPGATDKLLLNKDEAEETVRKCDILRSKMNNGEFRKKLEILNFDHFYRRISSSFAEKGQYDKGLLDELPCYVGWTFARILADGNVNSCLKSHRFPVGNIYNQKFLKIWNSPKQIEFRKNALDPKEGNPFFKLIGNDPGLKLGCYKSCDDIGRNLYMRSKVSSLDSPKKFLLKNLTRYFNLRRFYAGV